jgi:sec-independent protein translocase protein TatC
VSDYDDSEIEGSRAPLLSHLAELRSRLIVCAAAILVGFIGCFFFSQDIYLLLVRPFEMASALSGLKTKPGPFDLVLAVAGAIHPAITHTATLQATGPLEIFFTKIKLAVFGAVVVTFPVLAWQLYRFVAPGLYKRERRAFLPFLMASPVLFILGASLCYFVMLPFVMWFSLSQQVQSAAVNIVVIPKVSDYLDLVTKLLLAFGLCFQLPVILSLAGLAGLVDAKMLTTNRKYALLGIIVVSAFVTPPDMISPFLLAAPIYLLFEGSILCVRLIELRRKTEDAGLIA